MVCQTTAKPVVSQSLVGVVNACTPIFLFVFSVFVIVGCCIGVIKLDGATHNITGGERPCELAGVVAFCCGG